MAVTLPPARDVSPGVRIHLLQQAPVQALLAGQAPGQWFADADKHLKHSGKVDARLLRDRDGRLWFVKQYTPRGQLHRLLALCGMHRGVRMLRLSLMLAELDVPVPAPAAAVTQRDAGGARSWFVCQALIPARNLREAWETDQWQSLGGVPAVFARAATLFARLHGGGFVHGDMKWPNLMLGAGGQLVLTDLDGMSRPRVARWPGYGRDLARFLISAREFGVPEAAIDRLVADYARQRGVEAARVWRAITPSYNKLATRHRQKYGSSL